MKVFCILTLCICVLIAARLYTVRIRREAALCEGFLSFLNYAKTQVSFSCKTVQEICEGFCALHENSLPFLCGVREPVQAAVELKIKEQKALGERQKALMTEFFREFGLADEQASLRRIENYEALFYSEYENAREKSAKRVKLIRSLSLLTALALAIIFI